MRKKITLNLIIITIISTITIIAIADDNCQHNYIYNSINNGNVIYKCCKCNNITSKSITEVKDLWNDDMYNSNKDGYLDLTGDSFINAKDYAKANNEYKKYKKTPSLDIGDVI